MKRSVFVSGVSSGIGEALVRALVTRGDRVWGIARREEKLKEIQTLFSNGDFLYSACDVTRESQVQATLSAMEKSGFHPDVAVLNAGINEPDLLPEYDHDRYRQVLETNLFGVMVWVKGFLPTFRQRGAGQFVAISSISAFLTNDRGAGYSASKAALTSSFVSLRKRYARSGITFTTFHFGPIRTPMWKRGWFPMILSPEEASRRILRAIDRKEKVVDCPLPLGFAARATQLVPFL